MPALSNALQNRCQFVNGHAVALNQHAAGADGAGGRDLVPSNPLKRLGVQVELRRAIGAQPLPRRDYATVLQRKFPLPPSAAVDLQPQPQAVLSRCASFVRRAGQAAQMLVDVEIDLRQFRPRPSEIRLDGEAAHAG